MTIDTLNIGRTTLWRWKTHGIHPRKRVFIQPKINAWKELVMSYIKHNACLTQYKIKRLLATEHNVVLSLKAIRKIFKLNSFSRKRVKRKGTSNIDLEPRTRSFCHCFDEYVTQSRCMVSIDECGFSEKDVPIYGYSKKGEDVVISTKGGWKHISLLMAIFNNNTEPKYFIKAGSINQNDFNTFVKSLNLKNKNVIILDNAAIHKAADEHTKGELMFIPPYSPQFNPIELIFHTVKTNVRKQWMENKNTITKIKAAVSLIPTSEILSSFTHVTKVVKAFKDNTPVYFNGM